MKNLEIKTTNFQTLLVGEREVELEYNILGFKFLKRSFVTDEVISADTFIKAIIVKTDNETFKFPIENDELRNKLILFFRKEVNFNTLLNKWVGEKFTQ